MHTPTTTTSGSTVPPARYRHRLPQLDADLVLSDGGIETSLIYDQGIDLPDFAAFVLFEDDDGRTALRRYFDDYAELARSEGRPLLLETATWRASLDWGARHGLDHDGLVRVNQAAVELLEDVRADFETVDTPIVISGCIGPRGDGYRPDATMTIAEARSYHAVQARAFAASAADLITAITMNYTAEAIGIALAARDVGMPSVISFTVETDGRLPTGETLREAIQAVEAATDGAPVYYMVNCAHPTHFADVLATDQPWTRRIGGVRANASTMSHAELDEATELDAGDPHDLAARYRALRDLLPNVVVLGGCCGTNHEHISAISAANGAPPRTD